MDYSAGQDGPQRFCVDCRTKTFDESQRIKPTRPSLSLSGMLVEDAVTYFVPMYVPVHCPTI